MAKDRVGERKEKLAKYREKRRAGATPEPFGAEGAVRPGLFVVQKHAATSMHYDFRLEIGGVLVSWAVPKGPSLDPDDKRFAAATEDHPMEYGDFEGIIPKGNYGAGAVILWDQGRAVHEIEPEQGLRDGKLLFELHGYKLRGLFTLFRLKSEKEWLMMKKPDAYATGLGAEGMGEQSIVSGLTVEELRDGNPRIVRLTDRLEELGAKRRELRSDRVKVMLAQLRSEPFSRTGWIFELKYDGYRVVGERRMARVGTKPDVHLHYRSGREATLVFPDVVRFLGKLPYNLVLDGEVVVLDDAGKPSFQLLQKRALLTRPADILRAAVPYPATYFVFDLLGFERYDLRGLPLIERKRLLRQVLPPVGPIRYADHIDERGEGMYEQIRRMGLEGIVAKQASSPYRGGRSPKWLKVRAELTGDFVIVGFTRPKSSRPGFGALHLGQFQGNELTYAGRVGTGFDDKLLNELRSQLDRVVRDTPAFTGDPPKAKEHVWVEPELVAEIKYIEYTEVGHLRHPAFVRLRDDKKPIECVRDDLPPQPRESEAVEGPLQDLDEQPSVVVSRPEKVFWPAEGFTKGDLAAYYQAVTPWLLPFLRDRPVVLDRYPDGIDGKSFFQKKAPDFVPDWVVTREIWGDEASGEEARYYLANDERALRYLINLGAIPLHVWHSRLETLQQPDWCVLDLDAKDAPFSSVVTTARAIHDLAEDIGLPSFAKTSGATGAHVLIPLGSNLTYDQSKQLGEVLCKVISQRLPEETSIARLPSQRKSKVYLDFLQNGYGKLIVAPYSVRPRPGAPVSTPLRWSEVNARLDPSRFTIKTVPARLRRMKSDPWAEVLETVPDLPSVLARLAEVTE
ncbi:MAG: DNA ligase D [bacterium]|nr:DNA ligase D [bacterium]